MTEPLPALGIDVSKDALEAALWLDEDRYRQKSFRNSTAGLKALSAWLARHDVGRVHACLEATASYEEAATTYLYQQGHTVSVVNPKQIKSYAESQLRRGKTDRADARLIARYCHRERPRPWSPPPPEVYTLRQLTRGLDQLKRERDRLRNQILQTRHAAVQASLERVVESLQRQIASLEAEIRAHLEAHPELERQRDLLVSIPGVGQTTAAIVLAELADPKRFTSARQVAAYAGLVPSERTSGTSVRGRTRLSKVGNARLRRALFLPALSALTHNEAVQALRERLLQQGKERMEIVGAAMRKLLHICYGVLKSGRSFDPQLHLST